MCIHPSLRTWNANSPSAYKNFFVSMCVQMCFFLGFYFFPMWAIFFEVFIEFVTILLLFYVLVFWPRGMWDLSSSIRDQTSTPCIGR